MLNSPTLEILARLLRLYATENVLCPEKVIHSHFFIGHCHWYVAEFNGQDIFLGFANLGDPINAEWGYFTLSELREASAEGKVIDTETEELMAQFPVFVEWDEHWTPKPFREIAWPRL